MEYELGDYEKIGRHKGCKYGGQVMRLTPLKINGHQHPPTSPEEWFWCDGAEWIGEKQIHERCGASSIRGDDVAVK